MKTLPPVSPARAERIAAACAKLVDLLTRQPALQPVPVVAGALRDNHKEKRPHDTP